jgi:hypothetical protein
MRAKPRVPAACQQPRIKSQKYTRTPAQQLVPVARLQSRHGHRRRTHRRPPTRLKAATTALSPYLASATTLPAYATTQPNTMNVVSSWPQAGTPAAVPATTSWKPRAPGTHRRLPTRQQHSAATATRRCPAQRLRQRKTPLLAGRQRQQQRRLQQLRLVHPR